MGLGEKLHFLGYTFQYFNKILPKYKLFHDNQGKEAIACYPKREKYQEIIKKIKKIFLSNNNADAYTLIAKVNPVIRG